MSQRMEILQMAYQKLKASLTDHNVRTVCFNVCTTYYNVSIVTPLKET